MPDSDDSRRTSGAGTGEQVDEARTEIDWDRPETWPTEIGGAKGPEPTRYGDWERNGRCSDF